MRYISYVSPNGEGVRNPSSEFVRSLFRQGEAYWQDRTGCGHGVFELRINVLRTAYFEITCKDEIGFRLIYCDVKPEGHERFVSFDHNCTSNDNVLLHYAGEPDYVPLPMFVSPVLAERAAMEFCETGDRPANIPWFPLWQMDWDPTNGAWRRPERNDQ